MSDVKEIYDRIELNDLLVDRMDSIVDATLVMNYIDRLEARIKWITKRSRIACEIVGDNVVNEAVMYERMDEDDA